MGQTVANDRQQSRDLVVKEVAEKIEQLRPGQKDLLKKLYAASKKSRGEIVIELGNSLSIPTKAVLGRVGLLYEDLGFTQAPTEDEQRVVGDALTLLSRGGDAEPTAMPKDEQPPSPIVIKQGAPAPTKPTPQEYKGKGRWNRARALSDETIVNIATLSLPAFRAMGEKSMKVLTLVVEGLKDKEIAEQLDSNDGNVSALKAAMYITLNLSKLSIEDRVETLKALIRLDKELPRAEEPEKPKVVRRRGGEDMKVPLLGDEGQIRFISTRESEHAFDLTALRKEGFVPIFFTQLCLQQDNQVITTIVLIKKF